MKHGSKCLSYLVASVNTYRKRCTVIIGVPYPGEGLEIFQESLIPVKNQVQGGGKGGGKGHDPGEGTPMIMVHLVVTHAPVVESAETRPLCLRIHDRGQVLEISKLLFRQSRLLPNPDDVVGVKRLHHPRQCLHSVRRSDARHRAQHGKHIEHVILGGGKTMIDDRDGAARLEKRCERTTCRQSELEPESALHAPCSITNTHLLRSEVWRGVDEERLVPDVLLDLLPRFLAVPEALLRQRNLPVRNMNVSLESSGGATECIIIGLAGRLDLRGC